MSKLSFYNHKLNSVFYTLFSLFMSLYSLWLFNYSWNNGNNFLNNLPYLLVSLGGSILFLTCTFIFLLRIFTSKPNFWLDKNGIYKSKSVWSKGINLKWQQINGIGLLHHTQMNYFFWIPIFPIKYTVLIINHNYKNIRINLFGIDRNSQEILREIRNFCEFCNIKINTLPDQFENKKLNII